MFCENTDVSYLHYNEANKISYILQSYKGQP